MPRPDPPQDPPEDGTATRGRSIFSDKSYDNYNDDNSTPRGAARDPSAIMMTSRQIKAIAKSLDEADRQAKREARCQPRATATTITNRTREDPEFPQETGRASVYSEELEDEASEEMDDETDLEYQAQEHATAGNMKTCLVEASLVTEQPDIPNAEVVRHDVRGPDGDHSEKKEDGNSNQNEQGFVHYFTLNTALSAWVCVGIACLVVSIVIIAVVVVVVLSGNKDGSSSELQEANKDDISSQLQEGAALPDTNTTNAAAPLNDDTNPSPSCDSRTNALLPELMADFEINRATGDLATVSPNTSKAYLFRNSQLRSGNGLIAIIPAHEIRVCKTPVSISYKEYNGQSYYGVVCSQEATIYILDSNDLSLIATASIEGLETSSIISSQNVEDPFYYYFHGARHDATVAAFDVREMINRGNVLSSFAYDVAKDGAISAQGIIIYSRGPWFPTGFQANIISHDGWDTTATPTFFESYREHRSTPPYVPDTRNLMTAAGNQIYSNTLKNALGTVDFTVVGWANESNYIFGFAKNDSFVKGVMMASSSDFDTIGGISVPNGFFDTETPEIPHVVSNPGSKDDILVYRRELIAMDVKNELLMGFANHISLYPYYCFPGRMPEQV